MSVAATQVVLVVEDESIIRMLLCDALEDAGFVVVEAEGADPAIAAFDSGQDIGAVVTDLRMPGTMDGLGLARWMCTHTPGIPIIITSGFASQSEAETANPCIKRIVSKPYNPNEVAGWVGELLESGCGEPR